MQGFHVYQDIWTHIIVEVLACRREATNIEERYAIAVNKTEEVVGHVPRKILFLCAAFILPDHINYNHAKTCMDNQKNQHFSYGSPGEK